MKHKIKTSSFLGKTVAKDLRSAPFLIGGGIGFAAGVLSAALTSAVGGRGSLYYYLLKPPFALPRFWFLPVWSILYFAAGGAAGLVAFCPRGGCVTEKGKGLLRFTVMMLFNLLWCPLFFAARAFFIAFLDAAVILLFSVMATASFFRVRRTAGWLMTAYTAFVGYAVYLNFFIFLYHG